MTLAASHLAQWSVADAWRGIHLVLALTLISLSIRVMIQAQRVPDGWYARMGALVVGAVYVAGVGLEHEGDGVTWRLPTTTLFLVLGIVGVANIDPRWIGQLPSKREEFESRLTEVEKRLHRHRDGDGGRRTGDGGSVSIGLMTAATMSLALPLLAQTPAAGDPTGLTGYLAYGPLGLMVLGFLTGQIVPGRTAKRAEDENDRLRRLIEDRVLPLVQENTKVTEKAIEVLAELGNDARTPRRRAQS